MNCYAPTHAEANSSYVKTYLAINLIVIIFGIFSFCNGRIEFLGPFVLNTAVHFSSGGWIVLLLLTDESAEQFTFSNHAGKHILGSHGTFKGSSNMTHLLQVWSSVRS